MSNTLKPPRGWTPRPYGTSERMKEVRLRAGVTRPQMSAWLKIDVKEVAALEAGKRAWDSGLVNEWYKCCDRIGKYKY